MLYFFSILEDVMEDHLRGFPTKKFVRSGWSGRWSRFLGWHDGSIVELNLNPTSHESEGDGCGWEAEVGQIIIRRHGTSRHWARRDRQTDELPDQVMRKLEQHFDSAFIDRLLNEDFLSQIDWELYEERKRADPYMRIAPFSNYRRQA